MSSDKKTFMPQPWTVKAAEISLAVLLALVPFHAFLTVWGASFGASYTLLRLWSVVPLAVLTGSASYWYVRDAELRQWVASSYLMRLSLVYALLMLLFGGRGLALGTVDGTAMALGIFLDLRFVLLFAAVLTLTRYTKRTAAFWLRPVFVSGLIVAAFAVLQYLALPADFLKHFGYGAATIEPYETINNNAEYVRVASTLRGANPLGAYMAVVLALVIALWDRLRPRLAWAGVGVFGMGALFFSFSRSAWLGTAAALGFLVVMRLKVWRYWRRTSIIVTGCVVGLGILFALFGNSPFVQNALYHTDDSSTVEVSSNDARESALRSGVRDVLHEPLGRGAGSAGPASVHNESSSARLAENYFLQIGQEAGWFGLICWAAFTGAVGYQLWRQRRDPLALGLLAAFGGLVVVNMLSHAWTDDTLAYTWWGLAGVVIGLYIWKKPGDSR